MSNNQSEPIDIKKVKLEYRVILNLIPKRSSVLDLGCGDGELLNLLVKTKNVRGSGIEIGRTGGAEMRLVGDQCLAAGY